MFVRMTPFVVVPGIESNVVMCVVQIDGEFSGRSHGKYVIVTNIVYVFPFAFCDHRAKRRRGSP